MAGETSSCADVLERLAQVLEARKSADPADSYVARLYAGGIDAIAAKITEEAEETVQAAAGDEAALVHEIADLWFHTLVLLVHRDLAPQAILDELERRFGVSGIDEKASRSGAQAGE